MNYYKLRVDINRFPMEVFRQLEDKYFSAYVRAYETVDEKNSHYHYYVETLASSDSIRQFIRRKLGSGNGVYSLKCLDERYPIEYLAYLLKDDTNSVWFKIPDIIRKDANVYDSSVKESIKLKKRKKLQRLEVYILDRYGSFILNKEQLINDFVDYYIENSMPIRDYQIISELQCLLCKYDPDYKHEFCKRILEKMV